MYQSRVLRHRRDEEGHSSILESEHGFFLKWAPEARKNTQAAPGREENSVPTGSLCHYPSGGTNLGRRNTPERNQLLTMR